HHFTEEHEAAVRVAALVAMLVCEKDGVLNLLRELQQPVDYHQGFSEFLDELILLVATASKMPCIALRELRDDTLYCLKAYGFGDRPDDDLHLSPLADYTCFATVVETRQSFVARRRDGEAIQTILEKLHLDNVQSFIIVPVLVGQDIFGTLSFAILCDHEYTTLEQQGLQAVANATGVAIANYRNFHLAEERLFSQAKIGAAITTVDVAQSARHEARNHLQHAQETLTLVSGKSNALPSKFGEELRSSIDRISEQLQSVEAALQKIKTITKPPDREKRVMRVDDLWRDAFSLTVGRLAQQQINWNVKGSASVRVAPDYIKTAFLNLILNSIDAFRTAKKKGRSIDVTIENPGERAADVVIRYVDNAIGVDVSKLGPIPEEGLRSVVDIFLPGVTSKQDGSGYGLYLVRKILADHHGSIDLIDHRNGIVFQVKMPHATQGSK
ncbi:MAG: ATP-binding protein, partial [Bryobacteraceae bacterium]